MHCENIRQSKLGDHCSLPAHDDDDDEGQVFAALNKTRLAEWLVAKSANPVIQSSSPSIWESFFPGAITQERPPSPPSL